MITGIGVRVPGGVGTEAFCSGLDPAGTEPGRIAVSIGTAVGCTTSLDREYEQTSHGGSRWLVDHTRTVEQIFDYFIPSSIGRDVAWEIGAEGPVTVISTGCTSGLDRGAAAALCRSRPRRRRAGVPARRRPPSPVPPVAERKA